MGSTGAGIRKNLQIVSQGDWDTSVQWVRLEEGGIVHVHACARPESDIGSSGDQAASMYENLRMILEENGATPSDVVTEKLFCSNVDRQRTELESLRRRFYDFTEGVLPQTPAATFLQQPPCAPGRLCEMQAYVMLHEDGSPVIIRRLGFGDTKARSGTLVHTNGYDHVYLSNITGASDSWNLADFKSQAESMFIRVEESLRQQGLSYRNVVRAWFYLRDMEEDYAAFNAVRNRLYHEWGIGLLPASTGIQGAVYPTEHKCGMDVYALGGCSSYRTKRMHAPTMNEPPAYGSAFSRGLRLDRNDISLVFISGTASINRQGEIVHVDDIEKQVERMLHNVERLLGSEHVGLDSTLSCVTYLKSADYLDAYRKVCARHPVLQSIVNSVVVADVCRPKWLCEMELVASAG